MHINTTIYAHFQCADKIVTMSMMIVVVFLMITAVPNIHIQFTLGLCSAPNSLFVFANVQFFKPEYK